MRFNARVDWLGRIMREEVGKLAVMPYFEQAGFLLLSASSVWEGYRPGRGRARSARLAEVGQQYLRQAHLLRQYALGWADFDIDPAMVPFPENHTFPPPGAKVGPLLAQGLGEGSYYSLSSSGTIKNNEAALRLTAGAVSLAMESLEVAQAQVDELMTSNPVGKGVEGRARFITNVEDELELLVELPCFAPPACPIGETGLAALKRSAVLWTAANLADLQAQIEVCWSGKLHERDPGFSHFGIHWPETAGRFRRQSKAEYEGFARDVDDASAVEALLATHNNWVSRCTVDADSWHGREEAKRSELVIVALLNLLLQAFRTQNPEDEKLQLDYGRRELPASTH